MKVTDLSKLEQRLLPLILFALANNNRRKIFEFLIFSGEKKTLSGIAESTRISKRLVENHLQQLQIAGLIERFGYFGGPPPSPSYFSASSYGKRVYEGILKAIERSPYKKSK